MGIELAQAYVTVRANADQLESDFTAMKSRMMASMRDIAISAAGVFAPFYRMGQGILQAGIAQAASLETTHTEMSTLLGSMKETDETLERMTRFAVETPFEMPQLLSISQQMITFGERGDQLFRTLKMLGDASSGDAQKFGLLGLVFNQVRGVGHLLTQDFRQLSSRGVISLQDIAKYYKVSTAEAQKMLSNGKISFDEFRLILEGLTKEGGRFANGMEKQAKTLTGLRSTLSDSINVTKRIIAEPLIPYLKAMTAMWVYATDAVGIFVKEQGASISLAIVGATQFAKLGLAISGVTLASRLLGLTWKSMLMGTGVGIFFVALGATIGWLVGKFSEMTIFKDVFARLADTVRILKDAFAPLATMLAVGFSRGVKIAFDWIDSLITKFAEMSLNIAEWIQAIATHWKGLWDHLPALTAVAFSAMIDIAENAVVMMVNAMKNMVRNTIFELGKAAAAIELMQAKLKAMAMGKTLGPTERARIIIRQARNSQTIAEGLGLGKEQKNDGGLFDFSLRTRKIIEKSGLGKVFGDIFKTKKELEGKRTKPGTKTPEEEKKQEMPVPGPGGFQTKAGLFDISGFGKHLQSEMLKNDPAHKTNELLADSVAIQKKMLENTEKPPEKGGLGP